MADSTHTDAPADDPGIEERFRAFLTDEGLRYTATRASVLREVRAMEHHFGAEDVVARLHRRGVEVSRATVYRTLELLVQSELVSRVHLGQGHWQYEMAAGREHHDHLVCLSCGRVIEFRDETIERLQDEICARHEFTPLRHTHRISGHCKECDQRRRRGPDTLSVAPSPSERSAGMAERRLPT